MKLSFWRPLNSWLLLTLVMLPSQVGAATLLKSDFNTASPPAWPHTVVESSPRTLSAQVALRPVGTVDVANTTKRSGAILLTARPSGSIGKATWSAALVSGLLPVRNREKNPGKLTLSFSLSASVARPVTVRIESFSAAKRRIGGLTGIIYPAAPDFFQRYALDLYTLKRVGRGRFQPTAPFVKFTFEIAGASNRGGWPAGVDDQIRLDNVNYASPAYYVSPKGSDTNNGRTEQTAFATPQKALNVAQPGDIVLLMNGTYRAGLVPVASFPRPGLPDAWIVLKNYPGQHPTLTSTGWNIVSITKGSSQKFSHDPPLAYLEVRGLHIRGEGDIAKQKYPEAMDKADSRTNSNGIAVDCRYSIGVYHDIRIADNIVEYCPGCGIGTDADWVAIEGNICRSNSWTTIYATSGISVAGSVNFDAVDNIYKRLIRNNICCHNQTYEKWTAIGKYSDGNGIILDVNQGLDANQGHTAHPPSNYIGRSLVQSNLSFDNGGSGIHTVTADRVDIINNTAYLNSASVHLEYSEIFTYGSSDVHIINNILVAPVANLAAGEKPEPVNKIGGKNTDVVFSHNLYYGGNIAPTIGIGDIIGNPHFVNPSRDDKAADFHLRPDSPAVGKGMKTSFSPSLDLDGKPRKAAPAKGAYEK